jgi:integrase
MVQQGQILQMKSTAADGSALCGYRYRSVVATRGAYSEAALGLSGTWERRSSGHSSAFVVRTARRARPRSPNSSMSGKLRWLLAKAVRVFGDQQLGQLRAQEIAVWRMTIAAGHRFEATQALRQVLSRAVARGMIDVNPAKIGVDNPVATTAEKRPFESWAQLAEVASRLDGRSGALVMFAAATGLWPGEWIAFERRAIDRQARVVYVRRAFCNGRLKCTKTEGSVRVPPQEVALQAVEQIRDGAEADLLFPSVRGAYFDLHNFRTRESKPAPVAAGIVPLRRVYDLRHTFATFALRPGVSTFDLSGYMGPA